MSSLFRPRKAAHLESVKTMDSPSKDGPHRGEVNPRLWLVLGVVYIILGCVQLVLAALWGFWFGLAIGFSIGKMGFSLAGLGLTGGRPAPAPPPAGLRGRLARAGRAVVMWGSSKVLRLFWRLRWLVYLYGVLVAALVAIHWRSPDVRVPAFPAACPPGKRFGCTRVAEAAPHGAWRGAEPLQLAAPLAEVQAAVRAWVRDQPQAALLRPARGAGGAFVHARFVSLVWGFADDLFVGLRCDAEGRTVVEAQGQLRLGTSDLGVNRRRIHRLLDALAEAALPEGPCDAAAEEAAASAAADAAAAAAEAAAAAAEAVAAAALADAAAGDAGEAEAVEPEGAAGG